MYLKLTPVCFIQPHLCTSSIKLFENVNASHAFLAAISGTHKAHTPNNNYNNKEEPDFFNNAKWQHMQAKLKPTMQTVINRHTQI